VIYRLDVVYNSSSKLPKKLWMKDCFHFPSKNIHSHPSRKVVPAMFPG
jgi:hypothetical protein